MNEKEIKAPPAEPEKPGKPRSDADKNPHNFRNKSKEEMRELGKKGGRASGKKRREAKAMRETLNVLLTMALQPGTKAKTERMKSFAEIRGQNITVQEAILVAQLNKALKGDTRALEFIRDTMGQRPAIATEQTLKTDEKFIIIDDVPMEAPDGTAD